MKKHNPLYREIQWDEAAAETWLPDSIHEIPTKEFDDKTPTAVNQAEFCRWMELAAQNIESGGAGFAMGRRLLAFLQSEAKEEREYDDERADAPDDASFVISFINLWKRFRELVAQETDNTVWRWASTLAQQDIALAMQNHMELDLGSSITSDADRTELENLPVDEQSPDYAALVAELHLLKTIVHEDVPV